MEYVSKDYSKPLIPFSVFDPFIFDFEYNDHFENNIDNLLSVLIKIIESSGKKLFKYPYPFNITASEFRKRMVHSEMRDNYEEVFEYFDKYIDIEKIKVLDDPYLFEALKLEAIIKCQLDHQETKRFSSELTSNILTEYHNLFETKQEDQFKLIFDIAKLQLLGKARSLKELYMIIAKSIHYFYLNIDRKLAEPKLSDLIYNELLRISKIVDSFIEGGRESMKEESMISSDNESFEFYTGDNGDSLFESRKVKCEYEEIVESILRIGDDIIFNFQRPENCQVTLLIIGSSDCEIHDLQLRHASLLERSDCFIVEREAGREYLLLVSPPSISRTYEAITARQMHCESLRGNLGHNRECYINTYSHDRELRNSDDFKIALSVLDSHFQNKGMREIQEDLINWLRMFEPDEQNALVQIIANHKCIMRAELDAFKVFLGNFTGTDGRIIATLKSYSDFGGIYRLLSVIGYTDTRRLKIDDWISEILKCDPTSTELVFINDVLIGGNQTNKALDYYLGNQLLSELAEEKNYYVINSDQARAFIEKIKYIRKISFYAALYTEEAERNIIRYLTEWYCEIKQACPIIQVIGSKKVEFSSVLLDNNPNITVSNQNIFRKLITKEEMDKRFIFQDPETEKHYKDHKNTNNRNLVVRVKSVPKYSYKIFVLDPVIQGVSPLFNFIKEPKMCP